MSQADIVTLADALLADINATAFSQSFTARRTYLPIAELETQGVLSVTMLPRGDDITLTDRNATQHDMTFDVAVQKKLANVSNRDIDPLVYLTQQLLDYFWFNKLPNNTTLVTESVSILYYSDHLQQLRQFTSVISLTFRGWRTKP